MSYFAALSEKQTIGQDKPGMDLGDAIRCPLPVRPQGSDASLSGLYCVLEEAGCLLVPFVEERLQFETLLADLSTSFVNFPPNQVDSQIESALRCLVMFLGVDRGCLAELAIAQKQIIITHSSNTPAAAPHTRKGVGFDPAAVRSEPGLSGMEERVRLIQATLSITSASGQGTTVEVRIPLARSDP
jgi:hypothetical protein